MFGERQGGTWPAFNLAVVWSSLSSILWDNKISIIINLVRRQAIVRDIASLTPNFRFTSSSKNTPTSWNWWILSEVAIKSVSELTECHKISRKSVYVTINDDINKESRPFSVCIWWCRPYADQWRSTIFKADSYLFLFLFLINESAQEHQHNVKSAPKIDKNRFPYIFGCTVLTQNLRSQ